MCQVKPALSCSCCGNSPASLTALETVGETPREGKRVQFICTWVKTEPKHRTLIFSAPPNPTSSRRSRISAPCKPQKGSELVTVDSQHTGKEARALQLNAPCQNKVSSCGTLQRVRTPLKKCTQLLSSRPGHATFNRMLERPAS